MGHMKPRRLGLRSVAVIGLLVATATIVPSSAFAASGTMKVHDTADCSGKGNDPKVTIPFSLEFTGFAPYTTGTVTAYTQPGGVKVASGEVLVDGKGYRCVRVDGDAPPGKYKIVYDFGQGTGKQKVIEVVAAPTPPPTNPPTTAPPTTQPPTTQPPTSPPVTTGPPTTGPPATTSGPTSQPTSTGVATNGSLVLVPLGNVTAPALPATGGTGRIPLAPAAGLLIVGALLVAASRIRRTGSADRRH
jgi:hypothetical protein